MIHRRVPAEELSTGALIARIRWVQAGLATVEPGSPVRRALEAEEARLRQVLRDRFGAETITPDGIDWLLRPRAGGRSP